jgi:hypothetical protein
VDRVRRCDSQHLGPAAVLEAVQATAIPEAFKLHNVLPDNSGSKAVCLWEADTQDTVSNFVNGVVGQYSNNGFFEVGAANAVGLPS